MSNLFKVDSKKLTTEKQKRKYIEFVLTGKIFFENGVSKIDISKNTKAIDLFCIKPSQTMCLDCEYWPNKCFFIKI